MSSLRLNVVALSTAVTYATNIGAAGAPAGLVLTTILPVTGLGLIADAVNP